MSIDWTISIGNILTLIFIAIILWELFTARKSLEYGTWQDIVGKVMDLDKTVITNPKLQDLFSEEDTDEITKAEELCATSYLTCFEQLYMQKDIIKNQEYWDHWERYMRKLSSLPKFKKVFDGKNKEDFVQSFREDILEDENS